MAYYLLELPEALGQRVVKGTRKMLVEADSTTHARQLAASQDGTDQDWIDSTVTIADVTALTSADYTGWRYVCTIRDPAQGGAEGIVHQVEYTGVASDTVDLIGGELAALFNGQAAAAAIADDGGVFTDETDEADEVTDDDVTLFPAVPVAGTDRYYIGFGTKFSDLKVNVTTAGVGAYTIVWEYWDGDSWETLTVAGAGADFKTGGVQPVTFTAPSDWATTTINSQGPYYFIRAEIQSGGSSTVPLAGRIHIGSKTNASYSTPTLDAAAIADGLGDQSLRLDVYPTGAEAPMAAMTGAITDEGIAAAVLDVALTIPTAIPHLARRLKG
jgi:hypothetical protein